MTYHSGKQLRKQTPQNLIIFDVHDEIVWFPLNYFGLKRLAVNITARNSAGIDINHTT